MGPLAASAACCSSFVNSRMAARSAPSSTGSSGGAGCGGNGCGGNGPASEGCGAGGMMYSTDGCVDSAVPGAGAGPVPVSMSGSAVPGTAGGMASLPIPPADDARAAAPDGGRCPGLIGTPASFSDVKRSAASRAIASAAAAAAARLVGAQL